ncbi:PAN/Apple domain [Dillenia turbinata]|uniref:non-specific serine/threonine protein kinase n=1 Tax=Dillenia turbinata TaxID=194707 RepID=A0AAN8YYA9_9MAGN
MSGVHVMLQSLALISVFSFCSCLDTISRNQPFRDGDVLISENEKFALGFFSPGNSSRSYLGIWYNKVSKHNVVWVANRDNPINNSFGVLSVDRKGNLVLYDESINSLVWSANISSSYGSYVQLLDYGNLVLIEQNSQSLLWQSFDYPTDVMLPVMKIGSDRRSGKNWFITSWKSSDDPGSGDFKFGLDPRGSTQYILYNGSAWVWRPQPPWHWSDWSDKEFPGTYYFNRVNVNNQDQTYTSYTLDDPSILTQVVVDNTGSLQRVTWSEMDNQWVQDWSAPEGVCDEYGHCGPYSICSPSATTNIFECSCLPGYKPKSPSDWYVRDGSGGCVRNNNVSTCQNGEGFVKVAGVIIPDTSMGQIKTDLSSKKCKQECLKNCACDAYAATTTNGDGSEESVCFTWFGELMDIRPAPVEGINLYIRVDSIDFARKCWLTHGDVLISENEKFALGFFSPGNSSRSYLGIWYNKVSKHNVVWVANRDNPINNSFGVLSVDRKGNLVLYDESINSLVWSANISSNYGSYVQLLGYGNLVLIEQNSQSLLWQSFDYPTNVLLPVMKFGSDRRSGKNWFITSWKSSDDPGSGDFNEQSRPTYISCTLDDPSILTQMVIDNTGSLQRVTWSEMDQQWVQIWSAPEGVCDEYGHCGPNGICSPSATTNVFECSCLPGFKPKSPGNWYVRDGSGGCVRNNNISMCQNGEGFVEVAGEIVPDTSMAQIKTGLSSKKCMQECLKNCTCTAYAATTTNGDGSGESVCFTWFGELMDIRPAPSYGIDLYIRVDSIDLGSLNMEGRKRDPTQRIKVIIIVISLSFAVIALSIAIFALRRIRRKIQANTSNCAQASAATDEPQKNFSSENKLGQGGFGSVYKGHLPNGREIDVKRLSKDSGQGTGELINEVKLIVKLQHKNLVNLLGCCVQKEERMLVYEYLPNKSLDTFIFDQERKVNLDWEKRYKIILGIARGILYLHQDSRLKIIHRDLKTSNVLLDAAMNPKISDFGMAKICGGEQSHAKTIRVVGTYGYMSPEYAIFGKFSTKSDVFSFGVVLLEIISSKRNSIDYYDHPSLNLIGHVWDLWREGKALEIVDSSLKESCPSQEIERCIHVGLLCVQECAADRPMMSEAILMLESDMSLPCPKEPGFFVRNSSDSNKLVKNGENCSVNEVTITKVDPR